MSRAGTFVKRHIPRFFCGKLCFDTLLVVLVCYCISIIMMIVITLIAPILVLVLILVLLGCGCFGDALSGLSVLPPFSVLLFASVTDNHERKCTDGTARCPYFLGSSPARATSRNEHSQIMSDQSAWVTKKKWIFGCLLAKCKEASPKRQGRQVIQRLLHLLLRFCHVQ